MKKKTNVCYVLNIYLIVSNVIIKINVLSVKKILLYLIKETVLLIIYSVLLNFLIHYQINVKYFVLMDIIVTLVPIFVLNAIQYLIFNANHAQNYNVWYAKILILIQLVKIVYKFVLMDMLQMFKQVYA